MEQQRACLVVEDDDDIRGLITVVLSGAGFEVTAVGTGAEGIAAAADPAIALVTLDLGLPDMDGHVVARAIRALSTAPLLFLTARSGKDDILAGMASGADGYLTKPFHPGELKQLARQLAASTPPPQQTVSREQTTAGEPSSQARRPGRERPLGRRACLDQCLLGEEAG